MSAPVVPHCCNICVNFNHDDMICKFYEELVGEGDRKNITDCPSFFDGEKENDLLFLAQYIDEDKDGVVSDVIRSAVDNILNGYEEKFKIYVVGIARRKIKAMVKMVDIIDILLDKLSDIDTTLINDMTPQQTIRLLSELNTSVNNDLSFIMRLLQPDSTLKDLQILIDNKVLNINGSTPETEMKADEILKLTGTSRDKIRDAFEAILHSVEVPSTEEVHEITEEELEDLQTL